MKALKNYSKNADPMVTTSVFITEEQNEFIRRENLNLSAITRDAIEDLRKNYVPQKARTK